MLHFEGRSALSWSDCASEEAALLLNKENQVRRPWEDFTPSLVSEEDSMLWRKRVAKGGQYMSCSCGGLLGVGGGMVG